ncbi:MAG: helix-turn-helix domain-containing protein [Deltaproteobacteria bacterium]|nr:helix-turn-helix domain-containing protein [Deltaproteobacteria bacterium]
MSRRGRKPLGAAHVNHLDGTPLAKQRLELILKTMRGELTIAEACHALSIGESRFHAMRNQWLQASLESLEPRPAGRPCKQVELPSAEEVAALEAENQELRERVLTAEVREQLARVMPHVLHDAPIKKKRRARRRTAR